MLTELGWSMTCTDVNAEMLAVCAARLPGARCVLADADASFLPFPDRSALLVLCLEVEPVVHSDWFPAEVARVLRSEGELVGVAWNRWSARGLATSTITRLRGRGRHPYYRHSYRTWRRRMEAAGLQMIEERGLCWFPFSRASNSSLVPLAAAIEERTRLWKLPSLSPWVIFTARQALDGSGDPAGAEARKPA
jgi:SAM-dependent methyltransferase